MTAPPKRRWLRFSLRTMFIVVTIFGVWLGWQLKIVRGRKAIIAEVYRLHEKNPPFLRLYLGLESHEASEPESIVDFLGPGDYEYIRISPVRRLLGDESCVTLFLDPSHGPEFIERAERAFPEAVLFSISTSRPIRNKEFRDSLYAPPNIRKKNEGIIFKTGLIEK